MVDFSTGQLGSGCDPVVRRLLVLVREDSFSVSVRALEEKGTGSQVCTEGLRKLVLRHLMAGVKVSVIPVIVSVPKTNFNLEERVKVFKEPTYPPRTELSQERGVR